MCLNSFIKSPYAFFPPTRGGHKVLGYLPLLVSLPLVRQLPEQPEQSHGREREELLERNGSQWLCRLDNRVREEGREHERERKDRSIKGEENNTLLTAKVRRFLWTVRGEWISGCHSTVRGLLVCLSLDEFNYDNKAVNNSYFFFPPHTRARRTWNCRAQVQHITSGPSRPKRSTCNSCLISPR